MTAGELLTGTSQIEWAEVLLLGDGTDLEVTDLTGWDDYSVDLGNVARAGEHGSRPGLPQMPERTVTVEFNVVPAPPTSTQELRSVVRAATPLRLTESTLVVTDYTGEALLAYGQVQRRALPMAQGYRRRVEGCAIQWVCADPRRYSLAERTLNIPAPTPGVGGLPFPLEYPLDWGTPGIPGLGVAINDGDADTFPRIVFTGPLESPTLQNFLTGAKLEFDVELTDGQTLTVDCRAETAVSGGATVLPVVTADSVPLRAFTFVPGDENPLLFNAAGFPGAGTPQCTVSWRSAWW